LHSRGRDWGFGLSGRSRNDDCGLGLDCGRFRDRRNLSLWLDGGVLSTSGSGLLGRRLLGRLLLCLRFLGLDIADQTFVLRLATDAVSLRLDHTRGVGLDADPERDTEVEGLLVGEPKFSC
jgi:hypothetical protein